MKIYDITHPLSARTEPWPGDTPFALQRTWQIGKGAPVNLSRLTLSPHNGTHADAPFHYDDQGATMADVPLDRYVGPARVVGLEGRASISAACVSRLELGGVERLLIRTGSCPDLTRFNPALTYLEPEAVEHLAALGVRLIGTDAHSVDASDSKELPAHHACRRHGILILENLKLNDVPEGVYELIALPLKVVGADASPVRAILRAPAP